MSEGAPETITSWAAGQLQRALSTSTLSSDIRTARTSRLLLGLWPALARVLTPFLRFRSIDPVAQRHHHPLHLARDQAAEARTAVVRKQLPTPVQACVSPPSPLSSQMQPAAMRRTIEVSQHPVQADTDLGPLFLPWYSCMGNDQVFWNKVVKLKSATLELWRNGSTGCKVGAIKVIQRIIQTQTKGTADPRVSHSPKSP